jgi:hypothetical protein
MGRPMGTDVAPSASGARTVWQAANVVHSVGP